VTVSVRRLLLFPLALSLALATLFLGYGLMAPLAPQAVLAGAYATTTGVRSAHVVVEVTTRTLPDGAPVTHVMEGEIQFPDRVHMMTRLGDESLEVVTVGRKSYVRLSGQEGWKVQELPPFAMPVGSAGAPIGDVSALLRQMKSLGDVEQLPDEEVDGVSCARYRTQVAFRRLLEQARRLGTEDPEVRAWMEALSAAGQEPALRIEYWIGKRDHLVRQVRLQSVMPSPVKDGLATGTSHQLPLRSITMVMRLSDFNKPVHITAPKIGAR